MDPFGSQLFSGSGVLGTVAAGLAAAAEVDDPGADASGRLSLAILGLLVLAGLILVATVVYWRMTRPELVTAEATGMKWVAPVAAAADLDAAEDRQATSIAPLNAPVVAPVAPVAMPAGVSSTSVPEGVSPDMASTVTNPPLAVRPTVARPVARPPAPGPDAIAG